MWQGFTLHQLLVYKRWVVSHSTCCTMLSISSALGKFIPGLCLLLPKDSTWPGQVQIRVLRVAIKGQRTDKLFTLHYINSSLTYSRMSWKLQWTTNNSCFSVLASEHTVLHPSAPEQLLSPRTPTTVKYISLNLPWTWGREGHFTSRWWNLSRLCVQAFQPHTLETWEVLLSACFNAFAALLTTSCFLSILINPFHLEFATIRRCDGVYHR